MLCEHQRRRIAGELEDDAAEHQGEEHESQRAADRDQPRRHVARPGHGGADVAEAIGRTELADDAAGEHHDQAVADVEELVEVGRDQQDAAAAGARLAQRAPDEGGGADVEAAGRLRRDDQARGGIDLARQDQLLGIAAGKRTGRLGGGRVAHVPGVERLRRTPCAAASG